MYLLSTYEIWKVLVSLAKIIFFIANFHGLIIPKNMFRAKKIRLSRGVAVQSLIEIRIDDISAVLRATDLRSATLHQVGWIDAPHTQNFEI
jgi:hypothetical protein